MRAYLKHYRQSPRKVRLVANLVKGKRIPEARVLLDTLAKRAASPMRKLLDSAVANATQNNGVDEGNLFIKEFRVDGGFIMKRHMPRARGAVAPINKRTSNVSITLGELKSRDKLVKK